MNPSIHPTPSGNGVELGLARPCFDFSPWQPLRGTTSLPTMFHYPQAFLFDHSARSKPRPSLSFCPAYARGCCPHGESCALNHIDLHEISCKFDKKGCCKFGSSCYFKHSSKPIDQTSDLAPVIQKMALENSELAKRIEIAEQRITVLEKELHNLNFVQSKNDSMASQTPTKTIKGVKTTKTTSAKTRGKALVSTHSNSVVKLM